MLDIIELDKSLKFKIHFIPTLNLTIIELSILPEFIYFKLYRSLNVKITTFYLYLYFFSFFREI